MTKLLTGRVARMTLRRAMSELVEDGLLVRRQGSGTFTARPKTARRLVMASVSEEMHRRGLTPGSRNLELRRRHAVVVGAAITNPVALTARLVGEIRTLTVT